MLKIGDVVLEYQPGGASTASEEKSAAAASGKTPSRRSPVAASTQPVKRNGSMPVATATSVRAAPSIRYMARQLGIDLGAIAGSGPDGRILLDDLTPSIRKQATPPGAPIRDEHPEFGKPGERIKLLGLRRKIAERMVAAKREIPHYTYVDEVDVTALVQLRDALKGGLNGAGIKLTYLAFAVKAVTAALKEVPIVNSSFEEDAGEIVLHSHYHIGIATSTPGGLVVPVIHDADQKSLPQIAAEIERLSAQARTGKISLADLQGGTFTVTSFGNVGGLFATPIINPPQVGIMGMGKIVRRPVFDDAGAVKPADMLYLSYSFDHRFVDGAVGAVFGNAVAKRLRQPAAMLLPAKLI